MIGNKIINDGDKNALINKIFKNKLKSYVILVPNENSNTTICINAKKEIIVNIEINIVLIFPLSKHKDNLHAFI